MTPNFKSTLALVALIALSACSKKEAPPAPPPPPAPAAAAPAPAPAPVVEPVSVKQLVLANKLGADNKAVAPATAFAPADTIFAVVETAGTGKATLKALWTFHKGDKTAQVNEAQEELTLAGPASTEFHISKPSGWPKGDYQVEIFLNGTSAATEKFTVK
ncbi:MAG TPA: hypothetical protein VMC81_11100 [Rhodocyclaceae bacterium]|nr:hypothetical protein [Rhodocyclaceae bacterium]